MPLRQVALLALLVTLVPGAAQAGQREWRSARDDYDEARQRLEGGRLEAEELTAAAGALRAAAERMLAEEADDTVEHLLEVGVPSDSWRVSKQAADLLGTVSDEAAVRALTKGLDRVPGRLRPLVAGVLGAVRHERAVSALTRALRDKDEALRVAAAEALARQGSRAGPAASSLRRLLRDGSQAVRWAAARALELVGSGRPDGFPEPLVQPLTGLPDRLAHLDRVAFLIDASEAAAAEAFEDVIARQEAEQAAAEAAEAGGGKAPEPVGPVGPVSPQALAARLVTQALRGLGDDTRFYVARFGGRVDAFGRGWSGRRDVDAAAEWLARRPHRDYQRDPVRALGDALALEAPPQEVFLFLVGPPSTRGPGAAAEALEALTQQLWGRPVRVHVVRLQLAPEDADSATAQLAATTAERAFGEFVSGLSLVGGGRATRIDLPRYRAPAEGEAPAAPAIEVDLTQPLSSRDASTVRRALKDALATGGPGAAALVEQIAACPDARRAAPLVRDLLEGGDAALAEAAVRGFARNTAPEVHAVLLDALGRAREAALQLRLLRALADGPGAAVTAGLAAAVAGLQPDPARVAWRILAGRPADQLSPIASQLGRAARSAKGLAAFHASHALAQANGRPGPATTGLTIAGDRLLPERFVAGGVGFVLDTSSGMQVTLHQPAAPAEGEAPAPITCLDAATRELARALPAAALGEAAANVLTTTGRSWRRSAEALGRDAAAAVAFAASQRASGRRDVGDPLLSALGDPAVEELYLLVGGLPERGLGDRDPAALVERVREAQRARAVPLHVVCVLPPAPQGDPRAEAARRDLERALGDLYGTLAAESGGTFHLRAQLAGLR